MTQEFTEMFAGADPDDDDILEAAVDRGDSFVGTEEPAAVAAPAAVTDPVETIAPAEVAAEVVVEAPVADDPAVDPAPAKTGPIMLPKERYDKQKLRGDKAIAERDAIAAERDAARAELERLRAGGAPAASSAPTTTSAKLETLNSQYNEAILDGNLMEANKLFAEITGQLRVEAVQMAKQEVQRDQRMGTLEEQLSTAAETLATRFPELDDYNEDAFAPELAQEVQAIASSYIDRGMYSPGEALTRAAELVMRQVHPEYFTAAAPAPGAAPTAAPLAAAARTARAAAAQPPVVPAQSTSAPVRNISQMTDAEFERLGEAELAKLRGDDFIPS